ncbi:hypothetical protein HDR63_01495 [bacterium]|nr:hypothetical protein [bacterium]
MKKFSLCAILLGLFLGATNATAAGKYEDAVQGFSVNGATFYQKEISFTAEASKAIRQLFEDINKDSTAKNLSGAHLIKSLCQNGVEKDTIIVWGMEGAEFKVDCQKDLDPTKDVNYTAVFLEAHCAGYCSLYGGGFQSYAPGTCTCASGDAKNLPQEDAPQGQAPANNSEAEKAFRADMETLRNAFISKINALKNAG